MDARQSAYDQMENLARARGFGRADFGEMLAPLELRELRDGWLGGIDHPEVDVRLRMFIPHGDPDAWVRIDEWPQWPMDVIEERLESASPGDRFPPYVQAVLESSGWFPGRRVPEYLLDDFAAEVAAIPQEETALSLHEPARVKLREFGALWLPAWRGPAVKIAPVPGDTWVAENADVLQEMYEQPFCVVSRGRGAEIVMAEDGWLVALTVEGRFWSGRSFEEMIKQMVTGRGGSTRFMHSRFAEHLATEWSPFDS